MQYNTTVTCYCPPYKSSEVHIEVKQSFLLLRSSCNCAMTFILRLLFRLLFLWISPSSLYHLLPSCRPIPLPALSLYHAAILPPYFLFIDVNFLALLVFFWFSHLSLYLVRLPFVLEPTSTILPLLYLLSNPSFSSYSSSMSSHLPSSASLSPLVLFLGRVIPSHTPLVTRDCRHIKPRRYKSSHSSL